MKDEILKYIKVTIGVILCALGIVMILNADLGLSPWDVLNQGINIQSGITLGQANILVGIVVILIGIYFKQPIGSGTIINVALVGTFVDIFMFLDFLPWGDTVLKQIFLFGMGEIVLLLEVICIFLGDVDVVQEMGLWLFLLKRRDFLWEW